MGANILERGIATALAAILQRHEEPLHLVEGIELDNLYISRRIHSRSAASVTNDGEHHLDISGHSGDIEIIVINEDIAYLIRYGTRYEHHISKIQHDVIRYFLNQLIYITPEKGTCTDVAANIGRYLYCLHFFS